MEKDENKKVTQRDKKKDIKSKSSKDKEFKQNQYKFFIQPIQKTCM